MLNLFKVAAQDEAYRFRLQEAMVQDLYRRALIPVLFLLPILYVFYLVLADVIPHRPLIGWLFGGMILVLGPRLASILFVDRIKARYPDPRVRIAIFAIATALLGVGMAAINIIAAPIVSPEQLALMAIIAAGINSIAIVSMSPSLVSYLLYMVPNIASISIAVLIGPKLEYGGIFLFLTVSNLISLILMATYVHFVTRRSILLRLQADDANVTLQRVNSRLESEIEERVAAERALAKRNTELEALNTELASAQSQLLQSEKMASVGLLAAGMAHEINNPIAFVHSNLNSLSSYVSNIISVLDAYEELERTSGSNEAARDKVERLTSAIDINFIRGDIRTLLTESSDGLTRVENIVKNLKVFSNLEAAPRKFVDIHKGLESTISISTHEIQSKAEIVREYGDLPEIECLPAQINQVFLNLLINAAQAQEKRGKITIRTGRDEWSIWVQIADTGVGIDKADIGRIFDPFFTTKPVGVGPGLGLSSAYSIVKQHHGTIEVTSEVGVGSTFTVHLPLGPQPGLIVTNEEPQLHCPKH